MYCSISLRQFLHDSISPCMNLSLNPGFDCCHVARGSTSGETESMRHTKAHEPVLSGLAPHMFAPKLHSLANSVDVKRAPTKIIGLYINELDSKSGLWRHPVPFIFDPDPMQPTCKANLPPYYVFTHNWNGIGLNVGAWLWWLAKENSLLRPQVRIL
ncbi:hypothetical protein VNO77_07957 [Canavalia gladiata]|uniref:Uncharacterized protein n=1 Tax=Canavalia gladiata TaxID=3824 RepID=A0AAN9M8T9_CANGL